MEMCFANLKLASWHKIFRELFSESKQRQEIYQIVLCLNTILQLTFASVIHSP